MNTVVYLIKHSEVCPKGNLKFITGKNDFLKAENVILSVSGEKSAEQLSKVKELENLSSVYSSSYVRCLETAKYLALENNTVVHVDERFNERKVGNLGEMDFKEFTKLQAGDFDFKLSGGESLNAVKKRVVEAMKNILMFETGERIAVVSSSIALTVLLSAWCEAGRNYNDDIILTYRENTIVDGRWTSPMVFKVEFEGMNVVDVSYVDIFSEEQNKNQEN